MKKIWNVDSIPVQVNGEPSVDHAFFCASFAKQAQPGGDRKICSAKFSGPISWSLKSKHQSILSPDADKAGLVGAKWLVVKFQIISL